MRKVLVIDDSQANAFITAKLLQHCGYDARFELTGATALETAAAFMPDVVFIDLSMPDMSGYDVARQLRAQGADGNPKIVSLTGVLRGHGQDDDSVFDEYLLKPVSVETLRRVIDG